MSAADGFTKLVEIMARLRAPGGCPWDREQTHDSIKPYLIEEAYEVIEAIDAHDDGELCTELGDVLLQIVFHAEMASARGAFAIDDVVRSICDKMIRRHPHVFADTQVKDAAEVLRNWSKIKAEERRDHADQSAIAGVPRAMPALLRAQRLSEKASRVGFDWSHPEHVLDKLQEELNELRAAFHLGDKEAVEAELGDLIAAAANFGRHLDLNAEDALTKASDRFSRRFRYIEERLSEAGKDIRDTALPEQEALWQEAKRRV
ncbi:MAG: nucleoside triphosphate pyrophosphohydrolase [Deltaproteobacteria bacterium]|nr:nucleoside triphosphate pyrophosphohydrolase [Deltaproteobacteria bacterium]MBI3387243.1 nucleoside triphosphate pyrophosphohydrolase [Deltaproteobacteria bacterium]